MKKVEIAFICDDCGAPLPAEYVRRNEHAETYFNREQYNTAQFQVNTDCWIHVNVALEVGVDYGGTYRVLCPKCRVKWLKKALGQFEEALKDGSTTD